jgi:hypothetical protein
MIDRPFKPLLLDLLRQAHNSQNAFFQQLPAAELAQSGTPDCWSAKDHVAHLTFWRRRLTLYLQAIVNHEPQPEAVSFEQLNLKSTAIAPGQRALLNQIRHTWILSRALNT